MTYWRCRDQRSKCHARIMSKSCNGSEVAKISNSLHTHPPIFIDNRTKAAKKAKKSSTNKQGQVKQQRQTTNPDPLE